MLHPTQELEPPANPARFSHEFNRLCAELTIEHRLTPPRSPQANGMAERFNGRIDDVLQGNHFRSGEELEATLHRYVWLYSQKLPQSALGSRSPLQAMKDWHKLKPQLSKKRPYYRPGCDTYRRMELLDPQCAPLSHRIDYARGSVRNVMFKHPCRTNSRRVTSPIQQSGGAFPGGVSYGRPHLRPPWRGTCGGSTPFRRRSCPS